MIVCDLFCMPVVVSCRRELMDPVCTLGQAFPRLPRSTFPPPNLAGTAPSRLPSSQFHPAPDTFAPTPQSQPIRTPLPRCLAPRKWTSASSAPPTSRTSNRPTSPTCPKTTSANTTSTTPSPGRSSPTSPSTSPVRARRPTTPRKSWAMCWRRWKRIPAMASRTATSRV